MKRYAMVMLMLGAMLLTGIGNAQTGQPAIKADVPFDFTAGDKTIPAGECQVRMEGTAGTTLFIGNRDAKVSTYVLPLQTRSLNPSERTVLVFHKYGDRYFLARVERNGSDAGYQMKVTGVEKELRAQHKIAGEEIRLAAK